MELGSQLADYVSCALPNATLRSSNSI